MWTVGTEEEGLRTCDSEGRHRVRLAVGQDARSQGAWAGHELSSTHPTPEHPEGPHLLARQAGGHCSWEPPTQRASVRSPGLAPSCVLASRAQGTGHILNKPSKNM